MLDSVRAYVSLIQAQHARPERTIPPCSVVCCVVLCGESIDRLVLGFVPGPHLHA